jgi:hypothetical protein
MRKSDVSVAELRSAVARLVDAVEEKFGPHLSFPEDYYWNVPFDRATSLDTEPALDMGSVVDDIDSVRDLLSQNAGDLPVIWHEVQRITGMLRSIARLDVAH